MDESTAARFWRQVDKGGPVPAHQPDLGPCWVWTGTPSRRYGTFWYEGKNRLVYRFAYEQFVSPIPEGMEIDHLCKNTRCMRVTHLEAVTKKVNNARSSSPSALNAVKTECKRGHSLLDEANVYAQTSGGRGCRQCRDDYRREWSERRVASAPDPGPMPNRNCAQGHKFSEETTFVTKEGYWACKTCRTQASARQRERARAAKS